MSDNIPENERPKDEVADLAAEFGELGKKIHRAVNAAWQSEERYKIQSEISEGLERLSKELDEALKSARQSEVGKKVEEGVKQVREDLESGKVADEVRKGLLVALRALGAALDSLADSFTPRGSETKEDAPKK